MTVHRPAILVALVVLLLFHGTITSAASAADSGLIIAVAGDVQVVRAGHAEPAVEGLVLEPGDTISVRIGGVCSGFEIDGSPFHISGPAELVLGSGSGNGTLKKVRDFIAKQLAQWSGASRRRPLITRFPRAWKLDVRFPDTLIPAPEGAVRGSEPRFFWSTVPGIESYVITIASENGEEVKQTVLGYSMIAQHLEHGNGYMWRIEAQLGGARQVSNWSSFRVMAPEEENQLDEALSELTDLEAGVLLYVTGLHDEAVYRFDAAVNDASQRRSALRWRARALAAIGFDKNAYEDLLQTIDP